MHTPSTLSRLRRPVFAGGSLLAALAAPLSAQVLVPLSAGQNNPSAYVTTAPNDPTTFDVATGTATQSGAISGSGGIAKTGAGTLALTGTLSYTGATTVTGGTLAVTGDFARNAAVDISGAGSALTTTGSLQIGQNGTGSLALSSGGSASATGAIYLGNGIGGIASTGTATVSGSGSSLQTADTLYLGFFGAGTLTVGSGGAVSAGRLIFAYEPGYSGTLTLNTGGTLSLGGTGGLANYGNAASATFNFSGGTLRVTGSDLTTNVPATLTNASTVDTNGFNAALSGVLSGTGSLTKTGTGTLALSGSNTYSGGTSVTGGLVEFAALANLGSGNITLNGGGVRWATGSTVDVSARLNALGSAGGTFDTNGNNVTLASVVSGTGGLTKSGSGKLTLSATNTYSGGTTVTGGTLAVTNHNQVGSGDLTITGGTLTASSTFHAYHNGSVSGTGATFAVGNLAVQGSPLYTGETSNTTFTVANGGTVSTPALIVSAGSGSSFHLNAGGTLVTSGLFVSPGGTFNLAGGKLQVSGGELTTSGNITLTAASTLDTNGNNGSLYSVISGSGGLTKTGAGTLTLYYANTFTGGFTVSGGTVAAPGLFYLGSGPITVDGGTLQLAGSIYSVESLNRALTVTGASSALVAGSNISLATTDATTFTLAQGATASLGGKLYVGHGAAGTLDVSGTDSRLSVGSTLYVGVSTRGDVTVGSGGRISAGTLSLGINGSSTGSLTLNDGGTLSVGGSTGLVRASNNVAFNLAGGTIQVAGSDLESSVNATLTNTSTVDTNGYNATLSGVLSGTGALNKSGVGTLSLTGANTYSGGTTVSAGTLALTAANQLGSGGVTVNGGTLSTSNLGFDRSVTVTGAGSTLSSSGYAEFGSSGTGSLTVANGAHVSATTTVAVGVLNAAHGTIDLSGTDSRLDVGTTLYTGYLGQGTVTVGSGGTLAIGSQLQLGVLGGGNGTLNLNSGGTLALGGTDGLVAGGGTAHLNLSGGTLQVTGSALTTSVPATLTNTTTIDTNGLGATLSGALSGTGGLAKTGAGTLTLNGTHSYTGATTLSAGQLTLNGAAAGSAFTVSGTGTLGGNATVGALTIDAGGTLAPGNSPGRINASDTTFAGGGTFVFEFNQGASALAGTHYDLLSISGALALTATNGNPFLIDLRSLDQTSGLAGTPTDFDPAADYTFAFVTTTGGISGFSGDSFTLLTTHLDPSLTGAWSLALDGLNLNLVYTHAASAVPEPATCAALAGLGALALGFFRRRFIGPRSLS